MTKQIDPTLVGQLGGYVMAVLDMAVGRGQLSDAAAQTMVNRLVAMYQAGTGYVIPPTPPPQEGASSNLPEVPPDRVNLPG